MIPYASSLFVGRSKELKKLKNLANLKIASLVVIKGRRRIGKSYLINEFASGKRFLSFTGLPPVKETTAQSERNEFTRQMSEQLKTLTMISQDWGEIFTYLASQITEEPTVLLLDEISWMGSKDDEFLGKLKIVWDLYFSKINNLILVLCGSVSAWIEKNIISSTAFFGRITLTLSLEELTLAECNKFLEEKGFNWSPYEKLIVLSVTGGIPWYLTLINPAMNSEANIRTLAFEKEGVFVNEYERIFHDLFGKRSEFYKKIIYQLNLGPKEHKQIAEALQYSDSGALSDYLYELTEAGFIRRDYTWLIKSNETSRLSQYRLRDNYLHFYLKCILPNLEKINRGAFADVSLSSMPGWESLLGFQFEKLVLNNRNIILKRLNIALQDVINDNPFFQRRTTSHAGCQIDYLIQTRFKSLIACEIKFKRNLIKVDVIQETKNKLKALALPKGFSCSPVLIYAGELDEKILESGYFLECINFEELLTL